MKFFGYTIADWMPCEIPNCGNRAVDIHHIWCRRLKSYLLNAIENLMGLCRECHAKYGDITEKREWLQDIHNKFMEENGKN